MRLIILILRSSVLRYTMNKGKLFITKLPFVKVMGGVTDQPLERGQMIVKR